MSKKIRNIFALIIALAMVFTVCAASVAEEAAETENDEWLIETQVPPELAETENGESEDDDEDTIFLDDDWGYVDSEVIAEHTPAMTQEFIHADDPDWVPEETVEEVSNTVEAPVTETEAPAETEAPVAEETKKPAEEETEKPEATETEAPAEETEKPEVTETEAPAEETEKPEVTEIEAPAEETEKPEEEETEAPAEETEKPEEEETEAPAEETEKPGEEETEAPAEEETEEPEVTDETEESEETEEEEKAKVTVTVITTMLSDTEMKLSAVVMDPEERAYTYQWQQSVDGGETYEDLTDATEQDFVVELNEENLSNLWRVRVKSI